MTNMITYDVMKNWFSIYTKCSESWIAKTGSVVMPSISAALTLDISILYGLFDVPKRAQ